MMAIVIAILMPLLSAPQSYFGHPVAGFFLDRDFLTRSFQLPFSFNRSALGPGLAFFLKLLKLPLVFLLLTVLGVLSLLLKWLLVHQTLAFCGLYHSSRPLSIIQLAIVPHEIELPEIAMQVLPTDVVIDADQSSSDEGMAAFGGIDVNVSACVFKRAMGHR